MPQPAGSRVGSSGPQYCMAVGPFLESPSLPGPSQWATSPHPSRPFGAAAKKKAAATPRNSRLTTLRGDRTRRGARLWGGRVRVSGKGEGRVSGSTNVAVAALAQGSDVVSRRGAGLVRGKELVTHAYAHKGASHYWPERGHRLRCDASPGFCVCALLACSLPLLWPP
jgi:hypothetical protein